MTQPPANLHQQEQLKVLEEEVALLKKRIMDRDSRLDYAMEATNDGLWDWDLRTNQIEFSQSFLRMLGYEQLEWPSDLRTFRRHFLHPDDLPELEKLFVNAIEQHREHLTSQYRLMHRDGSIRWVRTQSKFFEQDDTGRPWRSVGVNTDITDLIRNRDELLNAKAQADRANNFKSEFLARISHEIRTPMNAIIGIGYLLQDTHLDDQQNSYLQSLNTAADSLLQTINQLLDFSKIESGKILLENSHFDLNQLFEKTTRLFASSALHRKVSIHFAIDEDVPQFLRGDASRLSQILNHFINNAFIHGKVDEVEVKVKQVFSRGNIVRLKFDVRDNGRGMTAERLDIVKRKISSQTIESLSIGKTSSVQICHLLINLMQGHLDITSEENQGTEVSFTINFETSHIGKKTLLEKSRDLKKLRLLIVDDNPIARTVLINTVENMKMYVDQAENAMGAIEKLIEADKQGLPYHFLLADYQMPVMNGLELARHIKTKLDLRQKPSVFLISAYHKDEIFQSTEYIQYIDDFFTKPISESRLFEAMALAILQNPELDQLTRKKVAMESDWDLSQLNVLIAEDNIVNQQVLKGILRKKGIAYQVANNGLEALDLLKNTERPFDAILMDLEMPEMDGISATKAIRSGQVQKTIPIIAVTAQAMRGDREKCLAAGMNDYLTKPVNPELLYKTLYEKAQRLKVAQHNVQTDQ